MTDNKQYWIWLSSIPGIGAVKSRKLLEYFEQPYNIFNSREDELKTLPFLNGSDVVNIRDKIIKDNVKKVIENTYKNNIKVITIEDELYPYYLKNIYDPPLVLYIKGNIIDNEKYLAVVGSRKATTYGLDMARKISSELTGYGITVVSGMARGIDTYAHRGALGVGGRTIAVLGCGVDVVYPYENKKLMERIISEGACISEYIPGMPPVAGNFPARNRIISGMSLGVIVIEAGEKSGSLITANFALEQGREVFALPGNVNSINSTGTNKLIREGAKIVTGIEDILEEFNLSYTEEKIKKFYQENNRDDKLLKGLEEDERKIAQCLVEGELHIDVLAKKTGFSIKSVNSILLMLELKCVVEQLPGKIFKLKH
ncbi:MAG: DNA-protecting protein DprA [Clostridiaceae bacterium]|nr:DNA-protecting protein DprA [Clostridiaceae bacterium]